MRLLGTSRLFHSMRVSHQKVSYSTIRMEGEKGSKKEGLGSLGLQSQRKS